MITLWLDEEGTIASIKISFLFLSLFSLVCAMIPFARHSRSCGTSVHDGSDNLTRSFFL